MERKGLFWAGALLMGAALADSGCSTAAAQGANPPLLRTAGAPVDLTVYKQDFAMIRQRREVDLKQGANRLRLDDVSRQLDPNSVTFDAKPGQDVVSTTFDMGIGSSGNAIQRLAGREVELILTSSEGKLGERLIGRLEPTADGGFLLRTPDRIYVNPQGTIAAKDDDDAPTMPGLSVQVTSDREGREALGMSYLTRGLSWSADYVAHLDPNSERMRIEAWATVTNTTGVPYRDANLTFVAGSPNRAVRAEAEGQNQMRYQDAAKGEMRAANSPVEDFGVAAPQAVGELYEYKVKSPATIGIDQMNRVRMFDASEVPVRLDYSVALPTLGGWDNPKARVGAQLAVHFQNREKDGLGMPLPAGAVRVYDDADTTSRYIGAATIGDLPKDAGTSLSLSKVFDVFAEPKVVKTTRIDKKTVERTLLIHVENAKAREVELRIVQPIATTSWKVVAGTEPQRLNTSTAQWKFKVPAESKRDLTVTVRMRD
ncbi:MAG: DUF4139 domain-containing protein [Fimbriimonas sp.]